MTKVLVVEDQPSVVSIIRYHFDNAGFQGVYAGDVDEAWRLIVGESPSAAVVDIKLPGPDGWTLIEKLRADGRFHKLPVVVLTGLLEPEVVERAADMGCEYLGKPFAASTLLNKIRRLMEGDHSEAMVQKAQASMGPVSQKISLVVADVVLLTSTYQIQGKIHLAPELPRFSDAWEGLMRDNRTFVPITDAKFMSPDGSRILAESPFAEIRKADILSVFQVQRDVPDRAGGFVAE